jgi:hypothetical protein
VRAELLPVLPSCGRVAEPVDGSSIQTGRLKKILAGGVYVVINFIVFAGIVGKSSSGAGEAGKEAERETGGSYGKRGFYDRYGRGYRLR